MNAHQFTEAEMNKAGLQFKSGLGFNMEWYDERFCQSEEYKIIDLYVPIL